MPLIDSYSYSREFTLTVALRLDENLKTAALRSQSAITQARGEFIEIGDCYQVLCPFFM